MVIGFNKEKLMKKLALLLMFASLSACFWERSTPPSAVIGAETGVELQPVSFSRLKNFDNDNLHEAIPAFAKSCEAVAAKPDLLQKAQIKITPEAYLRACRRFSALNIATDKEMRSFLQENFQPYLVLYNLNDNGKFTSYYEAEIKASRQKHGRYKYPIYGRPNDLLEINLQDFDRALPNKRLLGRVQNNKVVPYYTRAEIERHGVDAPVILWGDDAVDIYLMQIQGSAVAVLDDGSSVRIRYADNNGHNFVGIGSILLKKGLLKPGGASMDKIRDWLKANPQTAQVNMDENPRFIFHRISDADGPVGALGVSLTSGRSLAVDNGYIPLGSLLWLETTAPDNEPLQKLVLAQDIGGAIKGAIRGDYFWGHGEEALLSAGKMNATGRYYILIPRGSEVKIGK